MGEHEHDLVVRGGTVVDGTGNDRRVADVAVDDGRVSLVGEVPARARGARRRRADGHAGLGRHPHPLRRPGHLGPAVHAVVVARRHDRGDGQLRRRLRAREARPPRLAHRADGRRRGHPRHRAARGHQLGLGDRSPSTSTRSSACPLASTSARRCRTPRCAATSWATAAPTTPRSLPPRRSRRWARSPPRASAPARSASRRRGPCPQSTDGAHAEPHRDGRRAPRHRPRRSARPAQGVFELVADLADLDGRVRADPRDGRGERAPAVDHHAVRAPSGRLEGAARPHHGGPGRRRAHPGSGRLPARGRAHGSGGPTASAGHLAHLPGHGRRAPGRAGGPPARPN